MHGQRGMICAKPKASKRAGFQDWEKVTRSKVVINCTVTFACNEHSSLTGFACSARLPLTVTQHGVSTTMHRVRGGAEQNDEP